MSMKLAEAIRSLDPESMFSIKNDVISWETNPIDLETINAEVSRLEAEHAATEYKRLRAPEYPAIGDQLDAILKHLNYRRTQGDELVQEMDNIIGDWLAVKARFPKNG
jgi:hypothetical protein